jgi:hypothetical protein
MACRRAAAPGRASHWADVVVAALAASALLLAAFTVIGPAQESAAVAAPLADPTGPARTDHAVRGHVIFMFFFPTVFTSPSGMSR